MSHEVSHHSGVAGFIIKINKKVPFIIAGLVIMMGLTTVGTRYHWHPPEFVHHNWHSFQHGVHMLLWFFFTLMGAEISMKGLLKSGRLVLGATAGGMVVPFVFTLVLLKLISDVPTASALSISYGAMATDVPISVSLGAMATGGSGLVLLLMDTLSPLAIGDDLGGIVAMTSVYLSGDTMPWSTLAFIMLLLMGAYIMGERGQITSSRQVGDGPKEEVTTFFHVDSLLFWFGLAVVNTFFMIDVGAEMIIGGCLPFIFAPDTVKQRVIGLLEPIMPVILFLFGLSVGGIDLLNPDAWGAVTLATFLGGHFGKMIGIIGLSLAVRYTLPKTELFKNMPTGQIVTLGILAAVNGTVAIIFVEKGVSEGMITDAHAVQAKLGYFLTIFASMLEILAIKYSGVVVPAFRDWFFADSPDFQPEAS